MAGEVAASTHAYASAAEIAGAGDIGDAIFVHVLVHGDLLDLTGEILKPLELIDLTLKAELFPGETVEETFGKVGEGKAKTKKDDDCPPGKYYYPLDHLKRATGAMAMFGSKDVGKGDYAGFTTKPKWWSELPTAPAGSRWERGHLIGSQLGGDGGTELRNLVPLYRYANFPLMESYEKKARKAAESGDCVLYEAVPIYTDSRLYPDHVLIHARGTKGFKLDADVPNVPKPHDATI